MAAVILLKRAAGKAHTTSLDETNDDAVLGSIITSGQTTADLYNDANTTTVNVGGSALTTANLATGASVTTANLATGTGAGDTVNIGGAGSQTVIGGNLVVNGTTTTVDSEIVNIADNHLYLNNGYTTNSAETGGLVVNYLPTATGDTSDTGGFASATTVNTVGAATFSAGDIIQVSGSANPANDGLYEVVSHAANVLTIDSTPTEDFSQSAFTVDATDTTAVITQVNVSVMRAGTDGIWETGSGNTVPISYSDIGSGAGNSLQQAYVQGNTITTSAAEGDFDVSGTEAISLDAQAASNFTTTGANLTLSTVTSGTLLLDSAGLLDMNAAAGLDVDVTGTMDLLSTGTFSIDGTGNSNVTASSGNLTLSTLTSGDVIVDSVASVTVDGAEAAADAVSITASNAAGGIDMNAGTAGVAVDTTGPLSLDSTGTASNFTLAGSSAGAVTTTISVTNGGAGTAVLDIDAEDTITVDSAAISVDATSSSNFSVTANSAGTETLTFAATNAGAGVGAISMTADGDLTFDALGMTTPITLNQSGDLDLDAEFTATSIIGALNELKTGGAQGTTICDVYATTGRTVGEAVIIDGNNSAATAADASALSTSEGFVGIVTTVGASGEVCTHGTVTALFENGVATPAAGDPIYLSEVAGRVTGTAPSGAAQSGIVVYQIGIMKDNSTLTAVTTGTDETAGILLQPMQLIEL